MTLEPPDVVDPKLAAAVGDDAPPLWLEAQPAKPKAATAVNAANPVLRVLISSSPRVSYRVL
jgi:hypothetical protein